MKESQIYIWLIGSILFSVICGVIIYFAITQVAMSIGIIKPHYSAFILIPFIFVSLMLAALIASKISPISKRRVAISSVGGILMILWLVNTMSNVF